MIKLEPCSDAELVSVVIPCYNQAHFLGEAIESVLGQSYSHFEIIVVDDGSTDNTFEIAARYPIVHYIRQDNQGPSEARNSGLRESKGSYLVFLDADDRLLSNALEMGVEHLKAHPECAFVSGRHTRIAADGQLLWVQPPPLIEADYYAELLRGNYIGMHATVMYRRLVFESVGGFDTSLRFCEDYELYLRIARDFPVCCHDKVVAEYRWHDTNTSRNSALALRGSLDVLGSQRAYVKGKRRYEEAYKTGMKSWREAYGGPSARKVLVHMRKREWKQAIWDMLVLMRYHPLVLIRAWQKLTRRN